MACRCRKLSPFFCQFLSAIGESERGCRHIFEQCRLSPKPLGSPHQEQRLLLWMQYMLVMAPFVLIILTAVRNKPKLF